MKTTIDVECYKFTGKQIIIYLIASEYNFTYVVEGIKNRNWEGFYSSGDHIDVLQDLDDDWNSRKDVVLSEVDPDDDKKWNAVDHKLDKMWDKFHKDNYIELFEDEMPNWKKLKKLSSKDSKKLLEKESC